MKKQEPLAIAKKPTAKAKKETERPIPRREKKTARKPAKGKKATKAIIKKIGKESPLVGAFLGFMEELGLKPTVIEIETVPESPKPKMKVPKGAKKIKDVSELAEGLGLSKAGVSRVKKGLRKRGVK
jgi:hypothetical protein